MKSKAKKIHTTECSHRLTRTPVFESSIHYFSRCTCKPHLPIFPSFHIAADAWNQLPADIRTSSNLLKFKDSTRHYMGPGRQLPSVTTVAVSCSQIAYLGLLNYMCLLKLCSILPTQTSTFFFVSVQKTERIPRPRLSSTRCSERHGGRKRGGC